MSTTRPSASVPSALLALGCALGLLLAGAPAAAACPAAMQEVSGVGPEVGPEDGASIRFGDPATFAYDVDFFPGAHHDPSIPTPESVLGAPVGSRLARHDEIVALYRAWGQASDRVQVGTYAVSHEGRPLPYAVISAPENLARLDEILADHRRLADPRGVSAAETEAILARTPPVAWLGYSIHGDEVSGSDASLAVGYHLAACTDEDVVGLLRELVVVIDPCMNPDGRMRILSLVEQGSGYVHNLDHDGMHRGRWPYGRGNHFLFDLNRDWMAGTQPETRGRWRLAQAFHPQLFVDAHEMGAMDTFLFYPQAAPHNPHLPPGLGRWQGVFGDDAGAAFDAHGWGYYTREWADAWAPFYSDAWGSLNGAIGILYEQAGIFGAAMKRASGAVMTYRETVHHQVVASFANLDTLRARRDEILADYAAQRRANVADDAPGADRMFVLVPGRNADRERGLLDILRGQGIEASVTAEALTVSDAVDTLGHAHASLELAPGAVLVPARQPQGPLVKTYLGFDVRMDPAALIEERAELEREGTSRIYDDTAWSLAHAYDVEAYWCDLATADGQALADARGTDAAGAAPTVGVLSDGAATGAPVAWIVDGDDDGSVRFAARALAHGLSVHLGDEPFTSAGRAFPRGSVLLRRGEQDADLAGRVDALVARAAEEAGVTVFATGSGRSPDEGPDLGGGHFTLLEPPRVALLGNAPVRPDTYGHLWHLLDTGLGVPVTLVDAQSLGGTDLRRYNVLIVPPAWGDLAGPLARGEVAEWVRDGGTLIAVDGAASMIAGGALELSAVKRRRDVLDDLDDYAFAATREREAREITIDWDALWGDESLAVDGGAVAVPGVPEGEADAAGANGGAVGNGRAASGGEGAGAGGDDAAADTTANGAGASDEGDDGEDDSDPDAERQDAWMRRFAPRGVFLRGLVDTDAWITAGAGLEMPVFVDGSTAYLSRSPVRTAVRLAPAEDLRLSGLLWPEARDRLADTAWLTVERVGAGQVILFASLPDYRGYCRGSGRMLANAVVYGPGVGANLPVGW